MNLDQLEKVREIVFNHSEVLLQILIGKDPADGGQLYRKLGIDESLKNIITDSYRYGKLSALQGRDLANLPKAEVESLLKNLALSPSQKASIQFLNEKTKQTINTLTAKMTSNVVSAAVNEQLNMYGAIKDAIPSKKSRQSMVKKMRESSQDWERDWHRVAQTEMWDAKLHGEANTIIDGNSSLSTSGKDTMVFKRPAPNACAKCKQLYLDNNGKPRLFKLSELMANGTNYGLKQADWKPVVGATHPNCMCPLNVMPEGFEFDSNGQITPTKGGKTK